ncbi:PREDICTED: amyotrophic lateral sclerosis 2 chromosomal region candidate gene 12 protein [Condylura cristata]|uniref:amyotrophic lateral sclerosis 2 chromosomal region candidate gene 12 protein n=1 Tax=Condylura cristata TaxID=143302 RepID=UPI00033459AC|nr:PREDICTED: amyotrophic lateral sclerosis 2 chromosomal region candidate gene 12 protein [Condylura cristata]
MYPNSLMYCTCWDPWNLEPRKRVKTPQPPNKSPTGKPRLTPLPQATKKRNYIQPITKPVATPKGKISSGQKESDKLPQEEIRVPSCFSLLQNKERILSVTLGEKMFARKKRLELDVMNKMKMSRTDIIADLEEQISELMLIIEQMNRDHQSAQKLLANEMDLRSAEMQQNFENKNRELKEAHAAELSELEENYKAALKKEKLAAQEKLEEMEKNYKYLKNMFHMYQDSIYDEMEDKWSKKKAEWEKDEKLEREKILLQLKHRMSKKFELQSQKEKKKINDSYILMFESFNREKEILLKRHEDDVLQLEELKKTKMIMEEELHTQSVILESLNATLYHTQMELQKEKTMVGNLEKTFQAKLAENEEKFRCTIHLLTEENICLRKKINVKNEESYEEQCGKSTSVIMNETNGDSLNDDSNKRQDL